MVKFIALFGWEGEFKRKVCKKLDYLDEEINDKKRIKSLWVMW